MTRDSEICGRVNQDITLREGNTEIIIKVIAKVKAGRIILAVLQATIGVWREGDSNFCGLATGTRNKATNVLSRREKGKQDQPAQEEEGLLDLHGEVC